MENKNVFEETVKTLTDDAMSLQQKFHKLQESGDIRASIDCLRLLKDTLSLIKEYDWHLEYSEYEIDGHKEIAVWEQNHSGEIRNYKKWEIGKTMIYIESEKDNALVYMGGRKYLLSYKPNDEGNISLVDFLNEQDLSYSIYVDRHGFGEYIYDMLEKNGITCCTMRLDNNLRRIYSV